MKTGLTCNKTFNNLLTAGLLMTLQPCIASDAEDSPDWTPQYMLPAEPRKEQQAGLPAYPLRDNLLEVNISTGGPYKLYIDPLSVRSGKDSVVRYTVVIISSTGVWNIVNEGLHCGKNRYRRYAYGNAGEWRELADGPWLPLGGRGINQYRGVFYNDYMCNQVKPWSDPRQIVEKIRSSDYGYEE
ncbi:MAG: CNP1-like family protein [Gammaproteobacteria bacterium]